MNEENTITDYKKYLTEEKQPRQQEHFPYRDKQIVVENNNKTQKMQQEQAKDQHKQSINLIPATMFSPLRSSIKQSGISFMNHNSKYDKDSDFDQEDISMTENSTITYSKFKIKESAQKNQYEEQSEQSIDGTTKSVSNKKKSIDISHFLPPANPLAPKIYSEEFNIYTAINIQFEKLPEFNKKQKYSFEEPSISLKQLELILEKLNEQKPRTLFEHHNSIRDKLVYERYRNLNLLSNPTRIKETIFFSTILCKLNRLLRSDKKVFLQDQLKKDFDFKKKIKENAQRRKQIQMDQNTKVRAKAIETSINDSSIQNQNQSQQVQSNSSAQPGQQNQIEMTKCNSMSEITVESTSTTTYNNNNSINTQSNQNGNLSNNNTKTSFLTNTITLINDNEITSRQNTNNLITTSITNRSDSTNIISNIANNNDQISTLKDTLIFSSEFESGNLFTAYQVAENQYELILQNDINTKGNTQWFFFRVQNTKKNQTVTFTLLNLIKTGSLFNNGLCPAVFSKKRMEEKGIEWVREGQDIRYYKNNIFRDGFRMTKFYNSLTFSYTFDYNQDTVYFAHSFPYTYSELQEDLNKIMNDKQKSQYVSRKTLCTTLSGNVCDSLTITSTSAKKRGTRKGIVIFARQHPGETGGSFMMKGVIDFLLGNSQEAEFLRDACIFKIVPMVNPDGVIHGNYRCDLAGADLNRRWKKPNKKLHPTVYSVKEMIKKIHAERETKLILDLHGHSRKKTSLI